MKTSLKAKCSIATLAFPLILFGQKDTVKTVLPIPEAKPLIKKETAKKVVLNALFVGDYATSLTKNTDIYGTHYSTGAPSSNGFFLRYMRVQAKMDIMKDVSGQILVNLADFKDNPQTKVLEIAAIKYHINNYANIQVGQFRPYFGAEDIYPFEVHRSFYWSNQYNLFGKNNWESFQLGAAFFGSLEDKKIPLRYYYTFSNANGKNQNGDSNDAKSHSFRVEYRPLKELMVAANAAFTRYDRQPTQAFGGDINYEHPLKDRWTVGVDAEYKQGGNMAAYAASKMVGKSLSDYNAQGFYITPMIRKGFDGKFFDGVEFTCRYEYLADLMKNGNPSRSYVPMLSLVLGNAYTSRLSLLGVITKYNRQIPNTSQWNSNQILVQYQLRY